MKTFNYTKRILPIFIMIAVMFASCGEDLGGFLEEDNNVAPSAGLLAEGGFVLGSETVETEEAFKVKLSTSSGTANLKSVAIKEDGVIVDFSRLTINGVGASANPILLFTPDTEGFIWEIEVVAHSDVSTKSYLFEVTDELDLTNDVFVDITTTVGVPVPPSLEYLGNTSFSATPGSIISIPLNVVAGNKPLSHIAVSEGADFIEDLSRLYFGDMDTNFSANPHPLIEADQNGFEKNVYLRVSDNPGSQSYRVFVVDGNSDGAFVDIVVNTGTPTTLFEGILFNAGGVAGTGGLDLDDGISLGSRDAASEIKDEGIDLDLPATQNWKKQLSGVNGSEVRYALAGEGGAPEGFTFDGVTIKEEIIAAYDNGVAFDLRNDDNEMVSYELSIGDVFSVKNGENYYLVMVREINVVSSGNADHYVMDIKK